MILSFSNQPVKTKTGTVATIAELKAQLNIPVEFTDDDTILTDKLATAVEMVADDIHADILQTVNVLEHRLNPDGSAAQWPAYIHIYQAPLKTFTKIEISTDGSTYTELAATKYATEAKFNRIEITLLENVTAAKMKFTFTTGYADADRPLRLKQAVILKAADMFDTERSNYVIGTIVADNKVYFNLIYPHIRIYW